ncbi:MAG: hypothetical protein AB7G23_12715 [Vicinamibacterales bacterium]
MTDEWLWRRRSNRDVVDGVANLDAFTEEGQRQVLAELRRRGLPDPRPEGTRVEPPPPPPPAAPDPWRPCPQCGASSRAGSVFCEQCGAGLAPGAGVAAAGERSGVPEAPAPSAAHLKRQSVTLTVLLTFLTAGIYYPCWFLARKRAINALGGEALGTGVFVVAIVLFAVSVPVAVSAASLAETDPERSQALDLAARSVQLVASLLMLFQCFKVKRIFEQYLRPRRARDVTGRESVLGPFAFVATFLFQIYYLQYVINTRFDHDREEPAL